MFSLMVVTGWWLLAGGIAGYRINSGDLAVNI